MSGLISIWLIILLYIGNDMFKIRKYPVSIINQVHSVSVIAWWVINISGK